MSEEDYIRIIFDDDSTSDIRRDSTLNLLSNPNHDIRALAAHSLIDHHVLSFEEISELIKAETNPEVRSNLYVGLALIDKERSLALLSSRDIIIETEIESMHVAAALTIVKSSRKHLLDLFGFIYSDDNLVRELSIKLSKMIVSDQDTITDNFLDLLIADSSPT